jgi:hypothetical protein
MRRILIIGVILVGAWFVFQELNAPKTEDGNTEETAVEEVMPEEEGAETPEATETEVKRSPINREGLESGSTSVTPDKGTKESTTVIVPSAVEEKILESSEAPAVYITDTVKVFLYEWGIDLSTATVDAGTIEFLVFNNGQFTHHFGINGTSLGKVVPGEWAVFTAPLESGEVLISSPRQIDMKNEMQETLYVQ